MTTTTAQMRPSAEPLLQVESGNGVANNLISPSSSSRSSSASASASASFSRSPSPAGSIRSGGGNGNSSSGISPRHRHHHHHHVLENLSGGANNASTAGGRGLGLVRRILNSVRSSTGAQFKLLLLVLMVLQNSSTVLVGRYTRSSGSASSSDDDLYDVSHLVMVIEISKLVLSCLLEMRSTNGQLMLSLKQHVWHAPYDAIKIMVPAILYLVQNTLLYVALSNLTAPIFQVTYQAKLVTTAAVSVLMLNRRYNMRQWISLVTLSLGVAVAVLSEQKPTNKSVENSSSGGGGSTDLSVGLTAVSIACLSSALAGVYYEKILKRKQQQQQAKAKAAPPGGGGDNHKTAAGAVDAPPVAPEPSLWMRNIQLAFFSVVIALGKALLSGSGSNSNNDAGSNSNIGKSYLHGFNGWVWVLVGLQAGGGILVAAVIKYADNVLKGLATGVSVVLATAVSTLLFGTPLSGQFCFGAILILASVYFFSNPLPSSFVVAATTRRRSGGVGGGADSAMNQQETERMLPR